MNGVLSTEIGICLADHALAVSLFEVKRQKNLPSCLSKVCLSVKIFVSRKEVAVSPRPLLSNVVQIQGIECWRI